MTIDRRKSPPLSETQRAYLCAFDDVLYAHADAAHREVAEHAMQGLSGLMFAERGLVPPPLRPGRRR